MPVALITGTRRGIGHGAALALADAGFDIALADPPSDSDEGKDLPDLVTGRGRAVVTLEIDLVDRERTRSAVGELLDAWGGVDVLFHNAHRMGADLVPLAEVSIEEISSHVEANALGPLLMAMLVLPGMAARGRGTIIFRGSGIGMKDPSVPPGAGGWGIAAAVANGALHRMAGVVQNEYGAHGVRAFTLLPGFVLTDIPPEHRKLDEERLLPGRAETGGTGVVPEEAVTRLIAWLATADEAGVHAGGLIDAAELAVTLGLHPPWDRRG